MVEEKMREEEAKKKGERKANGGLEFGPHIKDPAELLSQLPNFFFPFFLSFSFLFIAFFFSTLKKKKITSWKEKNQKSNFQKKKKKGKKNLLEQIKDKNSSFF